MKDMEFQQSSEGASPVSESRLSHGSGFFPAVDLPLPEDLSRLLPDGDYRVEAFLGQGGMGAVYKGLQMPLQRPVAIKILHRTPTEDDFHFEDRFRREAYAMATLTHPNVVQVYDCGDAGDGFLFISMELVEGGDLSHAMKSGLVTPVTALPLFVHICEGVQAAHEHGLVHRDIKPANIFLTSCGKPKVADFGLAKRFDTQNAFCTQAGLGMGTPDYAAPEQYEEVEDIDHRADIYSLGVMFYQMLTGHLPRGVYKAPSQRAIMDTRLDAVVQKAMQADRAERYQRVEEMKAEVQHIIATWMEPPKPRFIMQTGKVYAHTSRVSTHTSRVPSLAVAKVLSNTGRVQAVTGRVPSVPRIAPLQPSSSLALVDAGLAPPPAIPARASHAVVHVAHPAPPKKSRAVLLAGALTAVVIAGVVAYISFRHPQPTAAARADPEATPRATSLAEQTDPSATAIYLSPLPVRPVRETLDLLALTDPIRDRISVSDRPDRNEWAREGTALMYKSDSTPGAVAAPVAFGCRDYEIELQVERLLGNGWLHLDLPLASGRVLPLMLNDPGRRILNEKDGVTWPRKDTMLHVTIRVARGAAGGNGDRLLIHDKVSGRDIMDWHGRLGPLGRPGDKHAEFPGEPMASLHLMPGAHAVRMWVLRVFEGRARGLRTANDVASSSRSSALTSTGSSGGGVEKPSAPRQLGASATSLPPAPPPLVREISDPWLARLDAGFRSRCDSDAQKPHAAAMVALNANYLRALTAARAAALKAGNVAELAAIEQEVARTRSATPPPQVDETGTPGTLVKLRATYRIAMAGHDTARDQAAALLYTLYLKALDAYIAELTKANNIDHAKEVQTFRSEIATRIP